MSFEQEIEELKKERDEMVTGLNNYMNQENGRG